jgi:hypothetical protein
MAALVALIVLSHKLPHARGERVSAGPGVEYMVGPDGLLYQCEMVKGPKRGYKTAALPGVLPAHAPELLRSSNIREVPDYKGPVAQGAAIVEASPAETELAQVRGLHAALVEEHRSVLAENDRLRTENGRLRGQLLARSETPASDSPAGIVAPPAAPASAPAPPAAPAEPPFSSAPPPPPPPPQAAPAGDNAPDLGAALGTSVGKLGAAVAGGEHDKYLPALRAAEVAGKNRASALAVIDARIQALGG